MPSSQPSQPPPPDHPDTTTPPNTDSPQSQQQPEPLSEEILLTIDEQRIRVLPGASDTAASFEFEAEDHTLGNALRYMIMKNPEVELCGYSIPHPSEAKMNLRIQTYDGTTVYDALEKGFDDLMDLCDVVTEKFTGARDRFASAQEV